MQSETMNVIKQSMRSSCFTVKFRDSRGKSLVTSSNMWPRIANYAKTNL